jgi:hypothetical protein
LVTAVRRQWLAALARAMPDASCFHVPAGVVPGNVRRTCDSSGAEWVCESDYERLGGVSVSPPCSASILAIASVCPRVCWSRCAEECDVR